MNCSTESSGSADLRAALARLDQTTVDHPYFKQARRDLQERLATHDLVLLVGPSGVGKESLVLSELRRLNEPIGDDPRLLRAAYFVAPSPQRGSFSWSALWTRWLDALDDPLPECKVDREFKRDRLSEGVSMQARRASIDALRRAAFAATRDRGVDVVFIDEAANLIPKERNRTLCDQLDVLRDLTDNGCCKIVLVATARILEPLNLSGELARRVGDVFFLRYAGARVRSFEYKCFARVVKTLVDGLPEASRPALHRRVRLLHAGSLGCVGILHDWFHLAIQRCLREQQEILEWAHFEATVLSDSKLQTLRDQACDDLFREQSARTFGGLLDTSEPQDVSARTAESVASSSAGSGPSVPARRRVGTPNPRRHAVP